MTMRWFVLLVALLLCGCPALYGGTDVTPTAIRSAGGLEKGSIKTLAIAPIMVPDTEGDFGDVQGLTLDAYNQILRAVETKGAMQFRVLTPFQFNATLDPRMTEKEREAALFEAAKRAGASHVFILESTKAQGGDISLSHAMGLAKRQATIPASVKILGSDVERTLWREDFNAEVKFSAISSATVKTEARRNVIEMGVSRFLNGYGL